MRLDWISQPTKKGQRRENIIILGASGLRSNQQQAHNINKLQEQTTCINRCKLQ